MDNRTKAFPGMRPEQALEVIADAAEAGLHTLARLKAHARFPGSKEIESYSRWMGAEEVRLGLWQFREATRLFEDLKAAAEALQLHMNHQ